jgi:type VI secretion system secreted protein Hcp
VAERWFLKVDGIAGESTDAAHKGEIDVESWSWGVSSSAGPGGGGGGGGAGKASFDDFHFVSRISAASPPLLNACATGSHIKTATLSGVRGTGKSKSVDFLKYQLSDITVTNVQQFDDESQVPTEQFSFNYSKVEMTYRPQTTSGKAGSPVRFGFDVKTNKKF